MSSRAANLSIVLLMLMATGVTVFFAQQQNYLTVLTRATSDSNEEIYKVVIPLDIVNQEGKTLTTEESNDDNWIGTGSEVRESYLGMMFKGSGIPATAEFVSAKLEMYSTATQWVEVNATIFAEENTIPLPYSSENPPSKRTVTTASVDYAVNEKWKSGEKYSIDVTAPVGEIFQKEPSTRIINLIVKGNGTKLGKKYFYNATSGQPPVLVVTYK